MNRQETKQVVKALWFNKEEKRMKVSIQLDESSQPIEYKNVRNTYTKGDLFCVYVDKGEVHKFPVSSIFRIVEDFGWHGDGSIETPNRDPKCTGGEYHGPDFPESVTKDYPKAKAAGPYDNYTSGIKEGWNVFESEVGDPNVESVIINTIDKDEGFYNTFGVKNSEE